MENETENTAPMHQLNSLVPMISTAISQASESKIDFECDICSDSGWVIDSPKFGVSGRARRCDCLEQKRIKRQLLAMPTLYADAKLETIKPNPKRHPSQSEVIESIKRNPLSSFGFSGRPGVGKTHFFWTLYVEAVRVGRTCIASTLTGLLDDYKLAFNRERDESPHRPKVVAEELRQNHTKYSIFLDDLDKARPSEYAAQQLFDLVDACLSYKHQLVWTSNLNAKALEAHFVKADIRYGLPIVRRLIEGGIYREMF